MMSAARLATARARSDAEEGRALLRALRSAAHVHAGFGSFAEYVGQLFAYGARFTYEKLRVAEALERLPVLSAALESRVLHWSAARELTRMAAAETQAAWLDGGRNVRDTFAKRLPSYAAPRTAGSTLTPLCSPCREPCSAAQTTPAAPATRYPSPYAPAATAAPSAPQATPSRSAQRQSRWPDATSNVALTRSDVRTQRTTPTWRTSREPATARASTVWRFRPGMPR
jgi:hypothetical protein